MALCFTLFFSSTELRAENIGFVDLERILAGYKKAQTFQTDMLKKREEYQSFFKEKQEKLEKEKKKKKSEKHIKKLITEMEEELKGKQEELFIAEAEFQRAILSEVTLAAQKVAKEYGIDVVLDKRVVYVGGFDLSDFILNKINQNISEK